MYVLPEAHGSTCSKSFRKHSAGAIACSRVTGKITDKVQFLYNFCVFYTHA